VANADPRGDGSRLAGGRYELRRLLGSGSMGRVFVASDAELGRDVALKMLHATQPDELFHLKQEFRALADLRHPNLVALHDLVVESGAPFFTMELLAGDDLVTYVAGGAAPLDRLSSERAARVLSVLPQLLDGLEALHATGRLHRDIKPGNILITPDGRVVLIDFGLATVPNLVPGAHDTILGGTFAYMAPELLQGLRPTAASDCYALGASLYHALTGSAPPPPVNLQRNAPHPAAVVAVPAELDELVAALLHADPTRRARLADARQRLALTAPSHVPRFAPSAAALWEAPFVDREESLAALDGALADVRAGKPVTMRIDGPSGIGKSALVRHFLSRASDASTRILTARCYPHETVPFNALDGIIDGLSEVLAEGAELEPLAPTGVAALLRLFPVLGRVPSLADSAAQGAPPSEPEQARRLAFQTLRGVLGQLARARPLIVWIDDLQWGDADSAVFLRQLAHGRDTPPLLVLLTYRGAEWEESAVAQALREDGQPLGRIISLAPLPASEAHALAAALLRGTTHGDGTAAAAIARESGGNPFLLCEMARYCAAGGASTPAGAPGTAPLPASIAEIVAWRLRTLDAEAHRLLAAVAVAGGPCRRTVAARAATLRAAGGEAVTALRNECLLRHSSGGDDSLLETFHDRIREAVVEALPAADRRGLHLGLAAALEQESDTDPIVLVEHYREGGDDARAARNAVAAAERAYAALAFEQAARLYDFALSVEPPPVARWRLLRGRADALAQAGRGSEAGTTYRDAARELAAREPEAAAVDELTRLAAEQLLRSGNIDEGTGELRAALRAVGEPYPATPFRAGLDLLRHRARLMLRGFGYRPRSEADVPAATLRRLDALWSAAVGLVWADSIRSAAFHGRHTRLALDAGEPTRVVRALCTEAVFHAAITARWAERRAAHALAEAEALSSTLDTPQAAGLTAVCTAGWSYFRGHFRTAWTESERAEHILRTRCTGVAWELTNVHIFGNWSLAHLGDLPRLRTRMPELLERARERDDLLAYCCLLGGLPTSMHLLGAGDVDGARAAVREALTKWPTRDFQLANYFGLVSATLADLYAGDAARARRRVEDAAATVRAVRLLDFRLVRVEFLQLSARCAIAAMATDRTLPSAARGRLATRVAKTIAEVGRAGMPWCAPLAAALEASRAAALGDVPRTVAALRQAVTGFDSADMGLWSAAARHQAGDSDGTAALKTAGVVDPDRYAEMLIPVRMLRPAASAAPSAP